MLLSSAWTNLWSIAAQSSVASIFQTTAIVGKAITICLVTSIHRPIISCYCTNNLINISTTSFPWLVPVSITLRSWNPSICCAEVVVHWNRAVIAGDHTSWCHAMVWRTYQEPSPPSPQWMYVVWVHESPPPGPMTKHELQYEMVSFWSRRSSDGAARAVPVMAVKVSRICEVNIALIYFCVRRCSYGCRVCIVDWVLVKMFLFVLLFVVLEKWTWGVRWWCFIPLIGSFEALFPWNRRLILLVHLLRCCSLCVDRKAEFDLVK